MDDNAAVRTGESRISPVEFSDVGGEPAVTPLVSVIIATRNRGADVLENLEALMPQCVGKPMEVFVVDSASSAKEAAILGTLRAREDLSFIRLDEPGLSRARNAALAHARGEWVALLDDDAVPRRDWADGLLAAVAACGPDVAVLAGKVVPRWPVDRGPGAVEPEMLGPRARMLLSVLDRSGRFETTDAPAAVGANMLFRRLPLTEAGGFDPTAGRVGENLASGEEALVIMELTAAGHRCWYDEAFAVDHKIHENRLHKTWLAERARNEGEVEWRRLKNSGRRAKRAVKMLITLPILAVLRVFDNPDEEYYLRFNHNLGLIQRMCGLTKKA